MFGVKCPLFVDFTYNSNMPYSKIIVITDKCFLVFLASGIRILCAFLTILFRLPLLPFFVYVGLSLVSSAIAILECIYVYVNLFVFYSKSVISIIWSQMT